MTKHRKITAHKGGRTKRLPTGWCTPEEFSTIRDACGDLSFSDWVIAAAKSPSVYGTYKLPDGKWQSIALFESATEACETLGFHAQGRGYLISENRSIINEILFQFQGKRSQVV